MIAVGIKKAVVRLFKGLMLTLFIACIGVVSLYSYTQYKVYLGLKDIEGEIHALIDDEKLAQDQLEMDMQYTMSDAYIEKIARERLGLIKSTDIRFVISNE